MLDPTPPVVTAVIVGVVVPLATVIVFASAEVTLVTVPAPPAAPLEAAVILPC